MQGFPGSPGQAERGQGGSVPVPPSTPSSEGRQRNEGGKGSGKDVSGMGLPGSGMPAWGAGGCYPMPGPSACFGAANGPGLMFGGPGFQNVPNFGQVPSNPFVAGQVPSSFQSVPNPCVQNMSSEVPSFSRFPPGGLTPQAANIRQIADLVGTLDGNQTRVLRDMLNERVGNQERMVPEFFGDVARNSGVPFVADESGETLLGDGSQSRSPPLDIFSKSEKWLTPAPVPTISEWKSREAEILGWSDYIGQLIAWAAQASEIFANEIGQATRWSDPIQWDVLSKPQKSRSSRLFAILKAAYSNHPRTNMLISVFGEGMSLQSFGSSGMHAGEANANGYELVRQLTLEFSLRSRAEALTVRASLASKSFTLSSSETSPGSIVSDTIRRMDFECSRYSKLIATLPSHVDSTGLSLPEADMLLMLLKSLPISVRDYCLHHSSGENFASYRSAARRWEEQQRLFQDSQATGSKKTVSCRSWRLSGKMRVGTQNGMTLVVKTLGNSQCIQFQIRQSVQNVGRNVTEPQIAVWTLVRFAVLNAMG